MLEVLDDFGVILVIELGGDEVVLADEQGQPHISRNRIGKADVGVQVDVLGHAGVGDDRTLQVGVRRQGEFGVHGGWPVVRRRDFVGPPGD